MRNSNLKLDYFHDKPVKKTCLQTLSDIKNGSGDKVQSHNLLVYYLVRGGLLIIGFVIGVVVIQYLSTDSGNQQWESRVDIQSHNQELGVKSKVEIKIKSEDSPKQNEKSIEEKFLEFDWSEEAGSYVEPMQEFVDILVDKLLMEEPTVPVNEECVAPELPAVTSSDCLKYPDVFSGDIEELPAPKIAHAIQFGFDVDTLEIHLHELYDVLDYFFIIEATKTNNKEISKPLLWEQLKRTPRFAMFQEKIVHLVLDDAEFSISPSSDKWEVEKRQELMRWKKIQQWNEANDNPLTDRDLIGFGDADEVASRWNVHLLKHCVQKSTSAVDIGIWFPMGDLSKALKTDHPVGDHAFTLGDPTYFKISGIKEDQIPNRARGHSDDYLLGGIHLTHYLSGPQLLIKHLTCTECMAAGPKRLARYQKGVKDGKSLRDVAKGEHAGTIQHYSKSKRNPLIPLDKAREDNKDDFDRIVYTPWFMKCNKERFPGWYALEDRHTR